jgi:hypothetical protein
MPDPIKKTFVPEFRSQKLQELILYIAKQCENDPNFGATKLNKALFFSDFYWYATTGKPITGATYQRLENGPAPKQLIPARAELLATDRAEIEERMRFNRKQKRLIAKASANLELFTGGEIAFVDTVIKVLLDGKSATQISDFSHDTCLGWQIAGDKEEIPYEAVFLSTSALTPIDLRVGHEVAKRHGLTA